MCLAVPMKIERLLENNKAIASQESLTIEIDISLLENPKSGDYVIVHAGFAIEKLDLEEAQARLTLFDEISRT